MYVEVPSVGFGGVGGKQWVYGAVGGLQVLEASSVYLEVHLEV